MLDRSLPPAFSRNFSFALPDPEVILAGSSQFIFLSGVQQEVFKIEVVLKAGKWYEPRPGLAHFTSLMLNKGTSKRNAGEIAEIVDYYGSQIEISSGYDFASISLYGLQKNIEKIVPLFLEILSDPTFPEGELDLQRQIFLQNLEINERKNSFVASKLIRRNIFGTHHPYGSSVERENAEALSASDLKNFFRSNFFPHEIYAVGHFNAQQVRWCADQFAQLPPGEPAPAENLLIVAGDSVEHVARPDSVQSTIRLGKSTINRNHADYFSLLLLNHVLGGYFGSRLMKNVREKKGLTYGIYSSLTPFKNGCLFSIGADVNKSNLELTRSEVKKELQLLGVDAVAKDELEIARNHLLGSFQLEVANPFSLLDKIKNVRLNQLGDRYYRNLISGIERITADELKGVAEKYFAVDDLTEVTVG
jgi:predicted Zn-dependent peptidase